MPTFLVNLIEINEHITLDGLGKPEKILEKFQIKVNELLEKHNPFKVREFTNNLLKAFEEGGEAFRIFMRRANDDNPIYDDLFLNFGIDTCAILDVAKYVERLYERGMEKSLNEIIEMGIAFNIEAIDFCVRRGLEFSDEAEAVSIFSAHMAEEFDI